MIQRDKNNHRERQKCGAGGLTHLCCKCFSHWRFGHHLSVHLSTVTYKADTVSHRGIWTAWSSEGGTGASGPSEHGPLGSGSRCGHRVGREGCSLVGPSGGRAERVHAADAAVTSPHLFLEASHGDGALTEVTRPQLRDHRQLNTRLFLLFHEDLGA